MQYVQTCCNVIAFGMNGNLKPKAEMGLLMCLFSWDLITSPAVWKTKELFVSHLIRKYSGKSFVALWKLPLQTF